MYVQPTQHNYSTLNTYSIATGTGQKLGKSKDLPVKCLVDQTYRQMTTD